MFPFSPRRFIGFDVGPNGVIYWPQMTMLQGSFHYTLSYVQISVESKHVIQYRQGTAEFNGKVNEEIPGLNCVCFVIQL